MTSLFVALFYVVHVTYSPYVEANETSGNNKERHNNISTPEVSTAQSLFFTSSGGRPLAARHGLYGIAVDFRKQTADELLAIHRLPISFDCLDFGADNEDLLSEVTYGENLRDEGTGSDQMRIKSLSYDSISGHVLMDVASSDDDGSLTLVRGRPCLEHNERDWFSATSTYSTVNCSTDNVTLSSAYRDTEILFYNAKITDNVRVGPFAYYDSVIFFLLQRFERPDYQTKLNIVELRQMSTTCADGTHLDAPVTATNSGFDVIDCSTVVANVTIEEYKSFHSLRPLGTLFVIRRERPTSPDRSRLDFYFQMQRLEAINDSDLVNITIVLYHASSSSALDQSSYSLRSSTPPATVSTLVPPRWPSRRKPVQVPPATVVAQSVPGPGSSDGGEEWAEPIYEQAVGSGHLKYVLVQLGGIDHRRSTLCWAAIDRVLCGRRSTETGRIDEIVTVVDESQSGAVCHAPDNSADLRHVISGVAVSHAVSDREVVVYFGCAAQVDLGDLGIDVDQQIGGAGLVRLPAYGVWPARVTPVRFEASEPIHAGAMFIVDRCAAFTNWNEDDVSSSSEAVAMHDHQAPEVTRWLRWLLVTIVSMTIWNESGNSFQDVCL